MPLLALPAPEKRRELELYCRVREAHLASSALLASNYDGPRLTKYVPHLPRHFAGLAASKHWTLQIVNGRPGDTVWIVGCIWNLRGGDVFQSLGMVIARTAETARRKHLSLTRKNMPASKKKASPISVTCWLAVSETVKTFKA